MTSAMIVKLAWEFAEREWAKVRPARPWASLTIKQRRVFLRALLEGARVDVNGEVDWSRMERRG